MTATRMDLNLLKVFDAIFEEPNLVAAGKRLSLSQSAVSHALARLRALVGDELFVRTGKGMAPTVRAHAMAPELRDCLNRIDAALGVAPFDPKTSTRRFFLAANDHATVVIVAPLLRKLRRAAPDIELVIRPSTRLDLAEQIDVGRIDVAIGIFAKVPPRLNARLLVSQGEAVVLCKDHPGARRKLTLEDLATYPLVTISVGGQEEGAVDGFILERGLARQSEMLNRHALEGALAGAGLRPRQRVTVPHSLAIPELLQGTDMLAIVPQTLAKALARGGQLRTRPLPYEGGTSSTSAVWHRRNDHEAAHLWLRDMVASVIR
nr:LysR substrate-binding domain-containing protein [uncultured Roseateles sp.]